MDRWKMRELKETDDITFAIQILYERRRGLTPYLYIDSTDGEYFPCRGGDWASGSGAGVFRLHLSGPRSGVSTDIGFRSAFYKKH